MAPRKKVRRTSSLPGLASDDLLGLVASSSSATAVAPGQPHPQPQPQPQPPVVQPLAVPATTTPAAPPPAYSFTFTTNLTPTTFQHADKDKDRASSSSSSTRPLTSSGGIGEPAEAASSPANSTTSNSRKRTADVLDDFYTDNIPSRSSNNANASTSTSTPHTRKFSAGHIPRPPNAFILFRSDLVARKAVPTSLEADHSTISKIIGVCWRTLPARQRKKWEQKALEAKAAHKKQYPDYRYTPVHRKGPTRKKAKKEQKKDDDRAAAMAQMLLGGNTGKDLEDKIRKMDESNPDTYQTTLNFGPPAGGAGGGDNGGPGGPQQFTFVQGFPAAGHTIELPSAPNLYTGLFQPRRHSSAPPAENGFLDPTGNASSSSAASTPRTPARDLSGGHFYDPSAQDTTSPTDSLVPLSRIARKLPTKSTHHLQPHHFYAEAQQEQARAQAAAAGASQNRKLKSSLAKAIRARAQGLGNPQPPSERDQLFIQSRWTDAAVSGADPENSSGEKRKKKKKGTGVIPKDLLLPTWDLNAHHTSNQSIDSTTSNNNNVFESNNVTSSPLTHADAIPGYVAAEHYSPSFAPAYSADDKYSPSGYDGVGMGDMGLGFGPFDMVSYEYGLPLTDDGLGAAVGGADITSGIAGLGGFDFADQFGGLGVSATEDYGYPLFTHNAEIASGPTSVNSASPHNSDGDDAAAFHYDMPTLPGTLTMAAQDPLAPFPAQDQVASYSPQIQHHPHPSSGQSQNSLHMHHASSSTSYLPITPAQQQHQQQSSQDATGGVMFEAPDWSAFQPGHNTHHSSAPAPLEPLDPLEPLPQPTNEAHYGYRAPPGSGPPSEVGDGDYGESAYPAHSPTVMHHTSAPSGIKHPMHPPPVPTHHQQQHQAHRQPPMQLSLNMQYARTSGGPYSAYTHSSAASPITADIADQMNQFSMQHATPIKQMGMDHTSSAIASSPALYHHGHVHSQSMEHLPHVHHQQQQQHVHMHTHSHSQTMMDAFAEPQSATGDQWGDWTNADPFGTQRASSGDNGEHGAVSLDPLSPPLGHSHGVGVVADAYRV